MESKRSTTRQSARSAGCSGVLPGAMSSWRLKKELGNSASMKPAPAASPITAWLQAGSAQAPARSGSGSASRKRPKKSQISPAVGMIIISPRTVLLSPNNRRFRKVSPPSSGSANLCDQLERSQSVWATPAPTNESNNNKVSGSASGAGTPPNSGIKASPPARRGRTIAGGSGASRPTGGTLAGSSSSFARPGM